MNNREIDALIAEKVFNYTCKDISQKKDGSVITVTDKDNNFQGWLLHYSTNISEAWEVLSKFDQVSLSVNGSYVNCVVWKVAYFVDGECDQFTFDANERTAPMAICLAALRAVGVEYEL